MVRKTRRTLTKSPEKPPSKPTRSSRSSRRHKVSTSNDESEGETPQTPEVTKNESENPNSDEETKSPNNKRCSRTRPSEVDDNIDESSATSRYGRSPSEIREELSEDGNNGNRIKGKSKSNSNTESCTTNVVESNIENDNVQANSDLSNNDGDNENVAQNLTENLNDGDRSVNQEEANPEVNFVSETIETESENVENQSEEFVVEKSDENIDPKERSHTPPLVDKPQVIDKEQSDFIAPENVSVEQESINTKENENEETGDEKLTSNKRLSLRRSHESEKIEEIPVPKKKLILKRSSERRSISVEETNIQDQTTDNSAAAIQDKPGEENSVKEVTNDGELWNSMYQSEEPETSSKKVQLKRKSDAKLEHKIELAEENVNKRRRQSTTSEQPAIQAQLKPQKPFKPLKLIRHLSMSTEDATPSPDEQSNQSENNPEIPQKKPNSHWISTNSSAYRVDIELLKTVCPNLKFASESEVKLESTPRIHKSVEPRKRLPESESEKSEEEPPVNNKSNNIRSEDDNIQEPAVNNNNVIESNSSIIALNRKISIVDDTAGKLRAPPSPARNPVSEVLFITNLVRPFTVKQLKELLERTGTIVDDGFWTDRIKSKCYVQYEASDQAEATRNALHGVNWPIGNGKKLVIEYATVEDLETAKNPPPPPVVAAPVIKEKTPEKENRTPDHHRDEDYQDRNVNRKRDGHTREWDVGKEEHRRRRSKSRSRSREKRHVRRSFTPDDYRPKKKKHEEPVPQKLMDDLFLKTKATPSIYWQPLSPEEISMKQQQRLVRMEEHKRRMEETRTTRRDPSTRGVPFRRR